MGKHSKSKPSSSAAFRRPDGGRVFPSPRVSASASAQPTAEQPPFLQPPTAPEGSIAIHEDHLRELRQHAFLIQKHQREAQEQFAAARIINDGLVARVQALYGIEIGPGHFMFDADNGWLIPPSEEPSAQEPQANAALASDPTVEVAPETDRDGDGDGDGDGDLQHEEALDDAARTDLSPAATAEEPTRTSSEGSSEHDPRSPGGDNAHNDRNTSNTRKS